MKVGIISQPLSNNYGGILQNFALQRVLQKFGFEVVTIDYVPCRPLWKIPCSWIKKVIQRKKLKKKQLLQQKSFIRKEIFDGFIKENIKKTETLKKLKSTLIEKHLFDAIVVGSDQVWRPRYNFNIKNMFLAFCKRENKLKRIAYAASFGVDEWEFSFSQTKECSSLAKRFNAIGVREDSAVKLCDRYLGVKATWVLDPTLLLHKEEYLNICKDVPVTSKKILAAYILDRNESVISMCESIAAERGLVLKFFEAGKNATLTVPEWLALFRDASYVVTDSFHGTVFSIIFEKNFKCLYNKNRGSTRFDSLLKIFYSGRMDEMREFSLNWIKSSLEA